MYFWLLVSRVRSTLHGTATHVECTELVHHAMQDVKRKCKRDFWSAYAAELVFWPAFQAVNFWKVPLRHQLLAVNLACLLDATFLCWCAKESSALSPAAADVLHNSWPDSLQHTPFEMNTNVPVCKACCVAVWH